MATIALLNSVKTPTPLSPGKRRIPLDDESTTPHKRQAFENEKHVQPVAGRPSTSKRASRLRSRSSLPATSTPVPPPRTKEIYEIPESPKQGKDSTESDETLRERLSTSKSGKGGRLAKSKRKLNRNIEKKPADKAAFNPKLEGTIDPLQNSKVILSTTDSPAKNTRSKHAPLLKKLHSNSLKTVVFDAHHSQGREKAAESISKSTTSTQQPKVQSVGQITSTTQENGNVTADDSEEVQASNDENEEGSLGEVTNHQVEDEASGHTNGKETGQQNGDRPRLTEQERDYTRREIAKSVGNGRKSGIGKERQEDPASGIQTDSRQREENHEGFHAQNLEVEVNEYGDEIVEEDVGDVEEEEQQDDTEDRNDHATATVADSQGGDSRKKKKGRPKMSDEERRERKEAAKREREANRLETETAKEDEFAQFGRKFIEDVKDVVEDVGGSEVWSRLGAGARTITAGLLKKKNKMSEKKTQVIWRALGKLDDMFTGRTEVDEEEISYFLSILQTRSTWSTLTRKGNIENGDETPTDLFEQIVPKSIYVLKTALAERFDLSLKVSWEEIYDLAGVALNLCKVAMDWDPKPSLLDTGIRQQVQRNIRPNLAHIQKVVKSKISLMNLAEQMAAFTKIQQQKKAEKERAWERRNNEWSSHLLQQSTVHKSYTHVGSKPSEAIEVTDNDEDDWADPSSYEPVRRPVRPKPLRHPTEDIPPPDPSIIWIEKENVALLNGLQRYFGVDRYNKILADPEFSKNLTEKDVDQCVARARFYKAGCSQVLKEKLEQGDTTFDWLRSV